MDGLIINPDWLDRSLAVPPRNFGGNFGPKKYAEKHEKETDYRCKIRVHLVLRFRV
jgi:hypothetical protein